MKATIILITFIILCIITLFIIHLITNNNNTETNIKSIKLNIIKNNNKNINYIKQQYFIQNTIDNNTTIMLNKLSNFILNNINNSTKFNLKKTGYEQVIINTDLNNNKHYIYDLFVFDKINYNDLKLKVNLINYNEQPINNNLIPNAMNVISTPNKFLIKYDNNTNYKKLNIHINSVDIINSTLATDKLDVINTTNIDNIKLHLNKNLDYHKFNNTSNDYYSVGEIKSNPFIEKSKIRNKWPDLNKDNKLFLSVNKNWNEWGIPNNDNNYIKYIQSTISNNPTVNKQIGIKGQYNNLFSKYNASGSIASSSSQPNP